MEMGRPRACPFPRRRFESGRPPLTRTLNPEAAGSSPAGGITHARSSEDQSAALRRRSSLVRVQPGVSVDPRRTGALRAPNPRPHSTTTKGGVDVYLKRFGTRRVPQWAPLPGQAPLTSPDVCEALPEDMP